MPNWCECDLTVSGPGPEVERFVAAARGPANIMYYRVAALEQAASDQGVDPPAMRAAPPGPDEELVFQRLCPIPPEVLAASYEPVGYHWELEHWGCKWGSCDATLAWGPDAGEIRFAEYGFLTPWTPPLAWVTHVAAAFPQLEFRLHYEEGGVGFAGDAEWTKGELTRDERYDYVPQEEEDEAAA